jgi:OPT family oligopeptide transporter
MQATTNQQIGLNVITELIIGYALPGRPIAMMLFKTWGYNTMTQALQFTSDFKLGHYMKISHRPMFWCQIVATVVAGTVQLSVQAWMFSNIEDLCSPDQRDGFTCPYTTVFGTASIVVGSHLLAIYRLLCSGLLSQWGVIGPQHFFSHGQLYHGLVFFFLVGVIAPLIQWVMHKGFKMNFLKYVNFPLIFSASNSMPLATPLNFVAWAFVCFVFNYRIRRRHFGWWSKYNCESIILVFHDNGADF